MAGSIVREPVDENHGVRWVAMFDVLGFKDHFGKQGVEATAKQYEKLWEEVYNAAGHVWQGCGEKSVVFHQVPYYIFSDSIFLCQRRLGDSRSVRYFISSAARIVYAALMVDPPVFLRGGVAKGPCYINLERQIFVGAPIIEADQLERAQAWVGAAVIGATADDDEEDFISDQPPPLKGGSGFEAAAVKALKWTEYGMSEGLFKIIDKLKWGRASAPADNKPYYDATIAFVEKAIKYRKDNGLP